MSRDDDGAAPVEIEAMPQGTRSTPAAISRIRSTRGRIKAKALTTLADQVCSSLTNLIPSVLAARFGGVDLLGGFTLLFTTYLIVLGFNRSLISEPLMSSAAAETGDTSERDSLSASLLYALLVALVAICASELIGANGFLVLSFALPGLMLQDLSRYIAFRRQKPATALFADLITLAVLVGGIPILQASPSIEVFVLVWGGANLLSAVVGLSLLRCWPSGLRTACSWLLESTRRIGAWLAFESAFYTLTTHGVVFGLAAIVGIGGVGDYRGAQVILGAAGTLNVALSAYFLPRLAAARATGYDYELVQRIRKRTILAAGAVVLFSVLVGPIAAKILYGGRIALNLPVLWILGLSTFLIVTTSSLVMHLKVLRQVGRYTVGRLICGGVGAMSTLLAASFFGILGAATGILLQSVLSVISDISSWRHATVLGTRDAGDGRRSTGISEVAPEEGRSRGL